MKVVFQHQKLRQRRIEKHLTQETLAELCDCSPRYLRDLERGIKYNLSADLLIRFAHTLDIPAGELMAVQVEDLMVSSI